MTKQETSQFDEFAARFVRQYWQAVADGSGNLPPNEPCEHTLEELLADVNCETSCVQSSGGRRNTAYSLRMLGSLGSEWLFTFKQAQSKWILVTALAINERERQRVDLLDHTYARWFRPFLERIISLATH